MFSVFAHRSNICCLRIPSRSLCFSASLSLSLSALVSLLFSLPFECACTRLDLDLYSALFSFFCRRFCFALLFYHFICFSRASLSHSLPPARCVCLTTVSHISKASPNRLIVSQASARRTICFASVNRLLTPFFYFCLAFVVVVAVVVPPIVIVISVVVGVVAFCYY